MGNPNYTIWHRIRWDIGEIRYALDRRKQKCLDKKTARLVKKTDDAAQLLEYYRKTERGDVRFAIYDKLAARERIVSFGGMDWIVLKEENGRRLLQARYLTEEALPFAKDLEVKVEYEGDGHYYTYPQLHWSSSVPRKYLNTEFMERFSEEERERILPVRIPYDSEESECLPDAAAAAQAPAEEVDRVFLLSRTEFLRYAKESVAALTGFTVNGEAKCSWTRTASPESVFVGNAYYESSAYVCPVSSDLEKMPVYQHFGFRPVKDHAAFGSINRLRPTVWVSC